MYRWRRFLQSIIINDLSIMIFHVYPRGCFRQLNPLIESTKYRFSNDDI